jgi:putative heme iron utilization protein
MEDGRVSLTCVAKKLENGGEEQTAARACYRSKHPDAFWSDFGDFSWWRLDLVGEEKPNLPAARVVMGFGRAGSLTSTQLSTASPDPVSAFSAPVAGHMNADHGDAVLAVARSATGLGERVVKAAMGRVDRLGFEVELVLASEENGEYENEKKESKRPLSKDAAAGERLRARVAFPQPAEDRKALKDRLVEMTKAAKGASG